MPETHGRTDLTADLVSAYVARNHVRAAELPSLIRSVHAALAGLGVPQASPVPAKPTDAQIRASIRPDAIISFEDGRPYKALRRHLTIRGLSPEAYRAKHGLPIDYPLVCATYSARRSAISRTIAARQRVPALQAAE